MKLHTLHEDTDKFPTIRKLLNAGMQIDKKFDLDALAWIAAALEAENINEWNWAEKVYTRFQPRKGLRGDTEAIEDWFAESYELEDIFADDFATEEEEDEALKQWLTEKIKELHVGEHYR